MDSDMALGASLVARIASSLSNLMRAGSSARMPALRLSRVRKGNKALLLKFAEH